VQHKGPLKVGTEAPLQKGICFERNENANEMAGQSRVGLKVGANVVVRNAITNAGGAASAGAALVGNQPGVIQRALDGQWIPTPIRLSLI